MDRLRRIAPIQAIAVTVATACTIPLAAGAALAQDTGDRSVDVRPAGESGLEIVEVRIYARNADTGEDLAWVNPGDTLVLPPRIEVRLRVEALPRGKGPRYPSASYDVTGSRPVAGILASNTERGSATLQTYGRTGRSTLSYRILDRSLAMPGTLRASTVEISVEESASIVEPAEPDTEVSHETVIEALYNGILLRDPEPSAVEAAAERLQDGGYTEAIALAGRIAASKESQKTVYDRGATLEQRLEALYLHLLGIEREDVDLDRWRTDMRWMLTRNVERVVNDMVRSEEFRERFGFRADDQGTPARRVRGVGSTRGG